MAILLHDMFDKYTCPFPDSKLNRLFLRKSNCASELREADEYASLFGTAFGQAWYWLKERKRASSVALNAYVTYVTLPWHWIVAGRPY